MFASLCAILCKNLFWLKGANLVETLFLCVLKQREFISSIGVIETLNLMQLSLKFDLN